MKTLIVRVLPENTAWDKMTSDFVDAMSGRKPDEPFTHIFPNVELLAKVMLAPNRLNIINTMAGSGSMSIRELSRRLERDFRAVHRDVQQMLNSGIIERVGDKIIFPYDAVHFDFTLENKAA